MRLAGIILTAAFVAAAPLTGCTQGSVDNLRDANRALQHQIVELEHRTESLESSRAAALARAQEAERLAGQERSQRTQVQARLDEAMRLYGDLESRLNQMDVMVLPPELDAALSDLAARYPDLMIYDPRRGMVQLVSDLTFDLGSAEVQSAAGESLNRLATVLKGDAAAQYEIRIVGHTDNVPIRNPGTLAKHPTNVHLSVHRAIAVRDVLAKAGVQSARMSVAGWGEHRPIVANPPGGARQNRRVELFLVASTGPAAPPSGAGTPIVDAPTRRPDEPLK